MRFSSLLLQLLFVMMLNTLYIGTEKTRETKSKGKLGSDESSSHIEIKAHLTSCNPAKGCSAEESTKSLEFVDFDRHEPLAANRVSNCRRKLIVTMKFTNIGKTQCEDKLVILDSVYNCFTQEKNRLLHPMVFKVKQDQVMQVYKMKFLHVVNSKATEEIINNESPNYKGCDDFSNQPTCGFSYYRGDKIPYSEGFCCSCNATKNTLHQPRVSQNSQEEKADSCYQSMSKESGNTRQDEEVSLKQDKSNVNYPLQVFRTAMERLKSQVVNTIFNFTHKKKIDDDRSTDVPNTEIVPHEHENNIIHSEENKHIIPTDNSKVNRSEISVSLNSSSSHKFDEISTQAKMSESSFLNKYTDGPLTSLHNSTNKGESLGEKKLNVENEEVSESVDGFNKKEEYIRQAGKYSENEQENVKKVNALNPREFKNIVQINNEENSDKGIRLQSLNNYQDVENMNQDKEIRYSPSNGVTAQYLPLIATESHLHTRQQLFSNNKKVRSLISEIKSIVHKLAKRGNFTRNKRNLSNTTEYKKEKNSHINETHDQTRNRNPQTSGERSQIMHKTGAKTENTLITQKLSEAERKKFELELSRAIDEVLLKHMKADPIFTKQFRRKHDEYRDNTTRRIAREVMAVLYEGDGMNGEHSLDEYYKHRLPAILGFTFSNLRTNAVDDSSNDNMTSQKIINNNGEVVIVPLNKSSRSSMKNLSPKNKREFQLPFIVAPHIARNKDQFERHKCPCPCIRCPICPRIPNECVTKCVENVHHSKQRTRYRFTTNKPSSKEKCRNTKPQRTFAMRERKGRTKPTHTNTRCKCATTKCTCSTTKRMCSSTKPMYTTTKRICSTTKQMYPGASIKVNLETKQKFPVTKRRYTNTQEKFTTKKCTYRNNTRIPTTKSFSIKNSTCIKKTTPIPCRFPTTNNVQNRTFATGLRNILPTTQRGNVLHSVHITVKVNTYEESKNNTKSVTYINTKRNFALRKNTVEVENGQTATKTVTSSANKTEESLRTSQEMSNNVVKIKLLNTLNPNQKSVNMSQKLIKGIPVEKKYYLTSEYSPVTTRMPTIYTKAPAVESQELSSVISEVHTKLQEKSKSVPWKSLRVPFDPHKLMVNTESAMTNNVNRRTESPNLGTEPLNIRTESPTEVLGKPFTSTPSHYAYVQVLAVKIPIVKTNAGRHEHKERANKTEGMKSKNLNRYNNVNYSTEYHQETRSPFMTDSGTATTPLQEIKHLITPKRLKLHHGRKLAIVIPVSNIILIPQHPSVSNIDQIKSQAISTTSLNKRYKRYEHLHRQKKLNHHLTLNHMEMSEKIGFHHNSKSRLAVSSKHFAPRRKLDNKQVHDTGNVEGCDVTCESNVATSTLSSVEHRHNTGHDNWFQTALKMRSKGEKGDNHRCPCTCPRCPVCPKGIKAFTSRSRSAVTSECGRVLKPSDAAIEWTRGVNKFDYGESTRQGAKSNKSESDESQLDLLPNIDSITFLSTIQPFENTDEKYNYTDMLQDLDSSIKNNYYSKATTTKPHNFGNNYNNGNFNENFDDEDNVNLSRNTSKQNQEPKLVLEKAEMRKNFGNINNKDDNVNKDFDNEDILNLKASTTEQSDVNKLVLEKVERRTEQIVEENYLLSPWNAVEILTSTKYPKKKNTADNSIRISPHSDSNMNEIAYDRHVKVTEIEEYQPAFQEMDHKKGLEILKPTPLHENSILYNSELFQKPMMFITSDGYEAFRGTTFENGKERLTRKNPPELFTKPTNIERGKHIIPLNIDSLSDNSFLDSKSTANLNQKNLLRIHVPDNFLETADNKSYDTLIITRIHGDVPLENFPSIIIPNNMAEESASTTVTTKSYDPTVHTIHTSTVNNTYTTDKLEEGNKNSQEASKLSDVELHMSVNGENEERKINKIIPKNNHSNKISQTTTHYPSKNRQPSENIKTASIKGSKELKSHYPKKYLTHNLRHVFTPHPKFVFSNNILDTEKRKFIKLFPIKLEKIDKNNLAISIAGNGAVNSISSTERISQSTGKESNPINLKLSDLFPFTDKVILKKGKNKESNGTNAKGSQTEKITLGGSSLRVVVPIEGIYIIPLPTSDSKTNSSENSNEVRHTELPRSTTEWPSTKQRDLHDSNADTKKILHPPNEDTHIPMHQDTFLPNITINSICTAENKSSKANVPRLNTKPVTSNGNSNIESFITSVMPAVTPDVVFSITPMQIMKVKRPVEHLILSPIAHVARRRPKNLHPSLKTTMRCLYKFHKTQSNTELVENALRNQYTIESIHEVGTSPAQFQSELPPTTNLPDITGPPLLLEGQRMNPHNQFQITRGESHINKIPQRHSGERVTDKVHLSPEAGLLWMQNDESEEKSTTTTTASTRTGANMTVIITLNKGKSDEVLSAFGEEDDKYKRNSKHLETNNLLLDHSASGNIIEPNLAMNKEYTTRKFNVLLNNFDVRTKDLTQPKNHEDERFLYNLQPILKPQFTYSQKSTVPILLNSEEYNAKAQLQRNNIKQNYVPNKVSELFNELHLPHNFPPTKGIFVNLPQPKHSIHSRKNVGSMNLGGDLNKVHKNTHTSILSPETKSYDGTQLKFFEPIVKAHPDRILPILEAEKTAKGVTENSMLFADSARSPKRHIMCGNSSSPMTVEYSQVPATVFQRELPYQKPTMTERALVSAELPRPLYLKHVSEIFQNPAPVNSALSTYTVPLNFQDKDAPKTSLEKALLPGASPPPQWPSPASAAPPPPAAATSAARRKRSVVSHGAARSHKRAHHFARRPPPPPTRLTGPSTALAPFLSPPQVPVWGRARRRWAAGDQRRKRRCRCRRRHRHRRGSRRRSPELSVNDYGRQIRGGQMCTANRPNVDPERFRESTHCLRYSRLWYAVHSLTDPQVGHNVRIQAYQQQNTPSKECGYWREITHNTRVLLDPSHPTIQGGNPTIFAFDYVAPKKIPDGVLFESDSMRLLVPQSPESGNSGDWEELKGGPGEFLVVPVEEISPNGTECDSVGVGYAAFAMQPDRCERPPGTCLRRQPADLWHHDATAEREGRSGRYFLRHYASLPPQPLRPLPASNAMHLVLDFDNLFTNLVDMEVRADNNLAIPKGLRAGSVFLEEVVTDGTAADYATLRATVANLALSAGPVRVRVHGCERAGGGPSGASGRTRWPRGGGDDDGMGDGESGGGWKWPQWNESSGALTLPPQHARPVLMRMPDAAPDAYVECTVEVVTGQSLVVASRSAAFRRGSRCACMWYCACVCLGAVVGSMACAPLRTRVYREAGAAGELPRDHDGDSVVMLSSLWFHFVLFGITLLICLTFLGIMKGLVGMCCCPAVGRWGLGMFLDEARRLPRYKEKHLADRRVMYDDEGVPVHPDTQKRTVQIHSRCTEMCVNSLFFLLFPVAIAMALCRRCCGGRLETEPMGNRYQRWPESHPTRSKRHHQHPSFTFLQDSASMSTQNFGTIPDTGVEPRAVPESLAIWGNEGGVLPGIPDEMKDEMDGRVPQMYPVQYVLEEGVRPYEDSEEEEADTRYVLQQLHRSRESMKKVSSKGVIKMEELEPFLSDQLRR